MRLLKGVLDFYIRSSLHVAICSMALIQLFHYYGVIYLSFNFFWLAFSIVLVGYNFIKYAPLLFKNKPFRFKGGIVAISLTAFLLLVYLLSFEVYSAYLVLGLAGLLALFYVIPFYHDKSLRLMSVIKILTVIVVWWIVIVIWPLYSVYVTVGNPNFSDVGLIILPERNWISYAVKSVELFLLIFCLLLPFEIRDLKYDDASLKTIPQLIGAKKTKYLGSIFLFIAFLIHHYYSSSYGAVYWVPLMMYLLIAVTIWYSDKFKSDYYASFYVEAIPAVWLGLYWVL